MREYTIDYLKKLEEQWLEIDNLVELASRYEDSDIDSYNSLCRATMVLCVSHMESFYKKLVQNIISDIEGIEFKKLPESMKRQFCHYFIGGEISKENNEKITLLIKELEGHTTFKLSYDIFLPSKNKNPKPSVIESICDVLGTKKIFMLLDDTVFDNIFSMTEKEIERLDNKINKRLCTILSEQKKIKLHFLRKNKKIINEEKSKKETVRQERTLWQLFFDDINTKRHDIAHGNSLNNSTSTAELKIIKGKCKVFQKLCIVVIFSNLIL
ncbi:HEPN domain-containing protein [Providencia huaxiensis]|uniref:MAE_28990/MAE_18760 family HEPN-like nuclease n=1 Tax=Providencia TaxID=586 RepID=UPI0032DB9EE7